MATHPVATVFAWLIVGLCLSLTSAASARAADGEGTPGVSGESDFRMYCASCHGEEGRGDGPKSFGLSSGSPDLTQLSTRYGGTFPRERLLRVIDGRDPLSGHVEREMPLWGQWFKLEAEDGLGGAEGDEGTVTRRIGELIAFIETLQN
jgi:Cytochrome c